MNLNYPRAQAISLAITVSCAAIASYLLISQAWIWRVTAQRRGARP